MTESLDCRVLKCPQPVLKTAIKVKTMPPGSNIEVLADCSSFADDIAKWCQKTGKVLINIVDNGGYKTAQVQL
jgi:TusA-related sulfurtransferase